MRFEFMDEYLIKSGFTILELSLALAYLLFLIFAPVGRRHTRTLNTNTILTMLCTRFLIVISKTGH